MATASARDILSTKKTCLCPKHSSDLNLCLMENSRARASVRRMFSCRLHLSWNTGVQRCSERRLLSTSGNPESPPRSKTDCKSREPRCELFSIKRCNPSKALLCNASTEQLRLAALRALRRPWIPSSRANRHLSCCRPISAAADGSMDCRNTENPKFEESEA